MLFIYKHDTWRILLEIEQRYTDPLFPPIKKDLSRMNNRDFDMPWLEEIRFCRLRLFYRAASTGHIEWFLGPELRGSIGHLLKKYMGCSGNSNQDCNQCSEEYKRNCVYAPFYLNLKDETKGFVLKQGPAFRSMKTAFEHGDTLQFDLIFLGEKSELFHHFFRAVRQYPLKLGRNGLVFKLVEAGFVNNTGEFVPLQNNKEMPVSELSFSANNLQTPCRIELTMHTPAEIRIKQKYYVKEPERLTFDLFILRTFDRIARIAVEHCNLSEEIKETIYPLRQTLIAEARKNRLVEHRASWKKVKIRNKPAKMFGGLCGTFVYE
jgi:hypothetical protein